VEVRAVLAPLNAQWEETSQRMNQLYQGINRQTRPASTSFGRSLALGGERVVGDSLIFQVEAARGRYWRAVVYDTYTGRQWLNTAEEETTYAVDEPVPYAAWAERIPLTQTITFFAPSSGMLFAAPDIIAVDRPLAAGIRPLPMTTAAGDPAVEITTARARTPLEANERYTVVSLQTQVTERALREASADYPESIRALYLQLPENFSSRVAADAATITAAYDTAYAKARALETFLRTYTYNDAIPAPAADQDPIEYFLYEIREGYCDYYASAMALMLRSIGIPARTVSGYAEGRYDEESRLYYITERDAHTWVEAYFPGYGWIEFEPTAGETQLNRPSGIERDDAEFFPDEFPGSEGGPAPESSLNEEAMPNPEDPRLQEQPFTLEDAAEIATDNWWVWAVVTPVILVAGLWVMRLLRVRGPSGFDPDLPPALYDRLLRWAARLGLAAPPSYTPYEQAETLTRALPEGSAAISHITETYVRYRFSPHSHLAQPSALRNDSIALSENWQTLQPIFWKRWLRRLLRIQPPARSNRFDLVKDQPAATEVPPHAR
jgi:transglutaminase-like putative cysteine protease